MNAEMPFVRLWVMHRNLFIRRKSNKNGSFSIQVLDKRAGRNFLVRSFGSSKVEEELRAMERLASDFIAT